MATLLEKYATKSLAYYDGLRMDILPLLPNHSKKVLEIGCGTGNTLVSLKEMGYCDWTCGVDLFDNAVESAKSKLDNVYQGNIEEMLLPLDAGSIDVVLCLDVLEHLVDPQKVLAYLHTLLTPGGMIIASIPNVRHYSVLLPLVFQNRWEYKDQGILDSTHLRFFVKSTAIELMQSSDLKIEEIVGNYGGRKSRLLNAFTLNQLESFFCIQYLIKAVNK